MSDSVTETQGKLERHARALLRAYPAEYRDGRAEEIIGTLLEAAPPGRTYPAAREAWSLVAGGRHARAARNHRQGAKASLRLALLLGISIYLCFDFCLIFALTRYAPGGASWLTDAEAAAGVAAALSPWLGSRAATTALAALAGTLYAYQELSVAYGYRGAAAAQASVTTTVSTLADLVVLAALAALSGGPVRLPRSWFWLPGAFPLALVPGRMLLSHHVFGPSTDMSIVMLDVLALLVVIVVCWLVTDARPAFALCAALLLWVVMDALPGLTDGPSPGMSMRLAEIFLIQSAVVLSVMVPAAWLMLRRQKAPGSRPYPGP